MAKQMIQTEPKIDQRDLLLLVDDDPLIADTLDFVLAREFEVLLADSRGKAISMLGSQTSRTPMLALVDLGLPPVPHRPDEGFELIRELIAAVPGIKILVLSGQDNDVNIQHALTLGAVDFVSKPAEPALLLSRLHHHQRLQQIEQQRESEQDFSIIGVSPATQMVNRQIEQFASSPFPVLITGESGTGKELVARALHSQSQRKAEPYMVLNCASIAPELLEAQLFGHRKGAFTGASEDHRGFFMEAGKGTLFLDEIGELPLSLQGKLLRVIESGEFYRVGETRQLQSQARILAASNKNLSEEVSAGRFRADLYHRLCILDIELPPLRARGHDVMLLLDYFQEVYADSVPPFSFDDDALDLWLDYDFPGNVRELRNIVIRLGTRYPGTVVGRNQLEKELELQLSTTTLSNEGDILSDEYIRQQLEAGTLKLDEITADVESHCIRIALELHNNNISKAAEALHINRTTLYSRVQKLGRH
jgi:DNA-binding NtrC family response regulator